jgi:sec-independent protein translocase protein TatC
MGSEEEQKGTPVPEAAVSSEGETQETASPESETQETAPGYPDDPYAYPDDSYPYEESSSPAAAAVTPEPAPGPEPAAAGGGGGAAPPAEKPAEEDDEDEGMLRMSFLEHLEELRSRIFKMLYGVGIAFALSLTFSKQLWLVVSAPAVDALRRLGIDPPRLAQITPMEAFNVIWIKLPILTAVFLSSPWILYQVWAFIAPGLYKRERKWAVPFVICSAGLFIAGGIFAYFVAFRFGLTFLLGVGRDVNVLPLVSISEYFNLFVNVTLGVGVVFELPVLIFFLTLLRVLNPRFLVSHSRYAILAIVILAAIITPTPDIFNLMIFAVPMILLFYVGVFASYLLVLQREERRFPWRKLLYPAIVVAVALSGMVYLAVAKYGYHLAPHWPFLVR